MSQSLHDFLAALAVPRVMVVTNYDTLVEEAFHEAGKTYDLVLCLADRKDVEFLSRMTSSEAISSLFFPHFWERSVLFLGYSLRDWNLRVVLKNLSKYLAKRATAEDDEDRLPSWAIQRKPSELERKLWAKRGVNIFDGGLEELAANLSARLGG